MRKPNILVTVIAMLLAVQSYGDTIPRSEYPRPQFERQQWACLNGEWTYQFDFGQSGIESNYQSSKGFDCKITVPFCPESSLSGIGHTDFINAMWYHRTISIPQSWDGKQIKRVI